MKIPPCLNHSLSTINTTIRADPARRASKILNQSPCRRASVKLRVDRMRFKSFKSFNGESKGARPLLGRLRQLGRLGRGKPPQNPVNPENPVILSKSNLVSLTVN